METLPGQGATGRESTENLTRVHDEASRFQLRGSGEAAPGQGLSQDPPAALPASPRRHELWPREHAGTHEGQLAPQHRSELGEVFLQLLCGETHLVIRARRLRAAAPPRPGLCWHTRRGRPTPPAPVKVRNGREGANSLLDTVQGTSATKMSKSRRERRPAARTALAAAMSGLRREGGTGEREGQPRPGRPEMAAAAALTREGGEDAFRRLFRFYRQRDASDLRGVVDFSAPGGQVKLGCFCPCPAPSGSERVPPSARCPLTVRGCGGVAAARSLHLLFPFVPDAECPVPPRFWLEDPALER